MNAGGGSQAYRVCEAGTSICSPDVTSVTERGYAPAMKEMGAAPDGAAPAFTARLP